jgi:hypothetical protein
VKGLLSTNTYAKPLNTHAHIGELWKLITLKITKLANEARLMHTKINTHQNDSNFLTHDL